MLTVDPDFKTVYEMRNEQEQHAGRKKRRVEQADGQEVCTVGMRWACMTALALLGAGIGYGLSRDQYEKYRGT